MIYFHRHTETYSSLVECERLTGISRWRLARALEDPDGLIVGIRPPAYIDEALTPDQGTDG